VLHFDLKTLFFSGVRELFMNINRVGILFHPMVEATRSKAKELAEFLTSRAISVWISSAWEMAKNKELLNMTDLILSVGGDGTILRSAQVALQNETPITGINMGTLGFLTELRVDEAFEKLPEILNGKGWIDQRSMLETQILPAIPELRPVSTYYALNDVVVARGAVARLIQVETSIDGEHLTNYRTDGVILATATGSTGYSLAAGGPILHSHSEDYLLVPIVAHLGLNYSIVLSANAEVKLQITTTHQSTLCIDGHIHMPLTDSSIVTVKHSSKKAKFLRIHPQNYFYSSLEQKLKGKK
jgi:NAD+ kinase